MRNRTVALCALLLAGCVTEGQPSLTHQEAKPAAAAALNVQLGFEYLQKGRRADAVIKFERALAQDPDNAEARYGLALVHEQVNDIKQARRWYEQAVDKAPKDGGIRNAYGTFLCKQGEHAAAERAFLDAANNLNYRTPEFALTNAGVCARQAKDPAKAEGYLRRALEANSSYAPALFELAEMKLGQGDALRARAFLQRLQDVARPEARTLLLGYRIESALGDQRAAQRLADQLRRDFRSSAEAAELDKR
jgi:type IV pilus assembly protein PilF